MQADLVIFSLKVLFCSSVCISLSVSTAWRRCVLIHQDTLLFGWEQGSLLTWFPRSLSSRLRSRSRTRLRLFSPRLPKRNSVNLIGVLAIWIDCRTFLVNVIPEVSHVSISEENIYKMRLRLFSFPPFRLQSLPPLRMRLPPSPSSWVFADCVDKWESGLNVTVSLQLGATLPTVSTAIQ